MEHDPLRCHPALLTLAFHSDGHSDSPGLRLIKAAAGTVLQSERWVCYRHAWNGPLKFARRLVVLPILALGLSGLGACASMPGLSGVQLNRDQASQGGKTFGDGVGQAATAPLDDLNLRRQEVPESLITARRAPYATAGLQRLRQQQRRQSELERQRHCGDLACAGAQNLLKSGLRFWKKA